MKNQTWDSIYFLNFWALAFSKPIAIINSMRVWVAPAAHMLFNFRGAFKAVDRWGHKLFGAFHIKIVNEIVTRSTTVQ